MGDKASEAAGNLEGDALDGAAEASDKVKEASTDAQDDADAASDAKKQVSEASGELEGVASPSCNDDEELHAGLCYVKCSGLTKDEYPHRMTPHMCCKTEEISCMVKEGQAVTDMKFALAPHPPRATSKAKE